MKLTKIHREAFIRGVMRDVPKVDYQTQVEAVISADIIATAPKKVAAVYEDLKLRPYVCSGRHTLNCYTSEGNAYRYFYGDAGLNSVSVIADYSPSPDAVKKLNAILDAAKLQNAQRDELSTKVHNAIWGCNTLKQAQEQLPEFLKYLPIEIKPGTTLAVQNPALDLAKYGWPEKETEAA